MQLTNDFMSFIQKYEDFRYFLQVLINFNMQLLYGEFDYKIFLKLKCGLTMLKNQYKINTAVDDDNLDNSMNIMFSKIEMKRNKVYLEHINQDNIIQKKYIEKHFNPIIIANKLNENPTRNIMEVLDEYEKYL
jgi:hypothetical protein